MGCDLHHKLNRFCHFVSIHAPTWGATKRDIQLFFKRLFQSTHPHGVRLWADSLCQVASCFNPRTHMGCVHIPQVDLAMIEKFQSTHPHGVRPNILLPYVCGIVSIHAPTWGATMRPGILSSAWKFQSTHPHGVRPYALCSIDYQHVNDMILRT